MPPRCPMDTYEVEGSVAVAFYLAVNVFLTKPPLLPEEVIDDKLFFLAEDNFRDLCASTSSSASFGSS